MNMRNNYERPDHVKVTMTDMHMIQPVVTFENICHFGF